MSVTPPSSPSPPSVRPRRDRPPPGYPKGRRVDAAARDEISGLLGDRPRRRDLLIEHLHRIQDRYGGLSARHIAALAAELRLAQAEVYEVAGFYAHFDVLDDGTPPPPPTVRVCDGIACALAGGEALRRTLAGTLGAGVRVIAAPCVGGCDKAPVAVVGRRPVWTADADTVAAATRAGLTEADPPAAVGLEAYLAGGGYRALRAVTVGERSGDEVLAAIEAADLRGLGGAGFPAARKWRFLGGTAPPRVVAVNADEGEPGTFKDRLLLESDPHRVLEGALIAARVVAADAIYLYVRDEYPAARALLADEIARLTAAGFADGIALHLRRGAGAYVCGEETAMLESLEGRRGLPRNRPPFPATRGLFGRPTLIHNVETLWWLRDILERGGAWYRDAGRPRFYSVSGRVREPGVKRAPSTVTARRLIEDHAGGMAHGHVFAAYLPGGASGGILPAAKADLPLDFGALDAEGCFVGSGAVVVLSDRDDLRAVVRNLLRFFADESCGQCTPCRVGCEKLLALTATPTWDGPLIGELARTMRDASICGLGQAAPNPVESALRLLAAAAP